VALLAQLVTVANGTRQVSSASFSTGFTPPATAILANSLWFLSLIISLICALSATLVQQWARAYVRDVQRGRSMQKRGLVHVFLCIGVERFHLDQASLWIVTLLHLAVTLFMIGLVAFLFPINIVVAWVSLGALALAGVAYVALSALPTFSPDCPYHTPLTPSIAAFFLIISISFIPLRRIDELCQTRLSSIICYIPRLICRLLCYIIDLCKATSESSASLTSFRTSLHTRNPAYTRRHMTLDNIQQSVPLVTYALDRAIGRVDEIHEVEAFLESFPKLLESLKGTAFFQRDADLDALASHMQLRMRLFFHQINTLLYSVTYSANGTPESTQVRRASTGLSTMRYLFEWCAKTTTHVQTDRDFYGLDDCAKLFHHWYILRTRGPAPVAFLAKIHAATLRSSLLFSQLKINISFANSLLRETETIRRLLPIHEAPCCRTVDFMATSKYESMAHIAHCSLFTCLFDIFSASPDTVHALSGLWIPLFDKMMKLSRILPLAPQKLSKVFTGLFAEAGLTHWLDSGSKFHLESAAEDRPSSPLLERYPQLVGAFLKLARAVISSQPSAPAASAPPSADNPSGEAATRCPGEPRVASSVPPTSGEYEDEYHSTDAYQPTSSEHAARASPAVLAHGNEEGPYIIMARITGRSARGGDESAYGMWLA
jgi:hypothetical protein